MAGPRIGRERRALLAAVAALGLDLTFLAWLGIGTPMVAGLAVYAITEAWPASARVPVVIATVALIVDVPLTIWITVAVDADQLASWIVYWVSAAVISWFLPWALSRGRDLAGSRLRAGRHV